MKIASIQAKYLFFLIACLALLIFVQLTTASSTTLAYTQAAVSAPLAWSEVDDFEGLSNGAINGRNGWSGTEGTVENDPSDSSNKVLLIDDYSASYSRKTLPTFINNGSNGTMFFRLRRDSGIDIFAGASDSFSPTNFSEYRAQVGSRPADGNDWTIRSGENFLRSTNSDGFPANEWVCVWLLINNSSDNYQVYVQGGPYSSATRLNTSSGSTFGFREGSTSNPIRSFYTRAGEASGGLYIDDIYVEPSSTTTSTPAGVSCSSNSASPPQVSQPSNQLSTLGDYTSLSISAFDSNGESLTYSANNLPPGLNISSSTGFIDGTSTNAGVYSVQVTARNQSSLSSSTSFQWRINTPPSITSPGNQVGTVGDIVDLSISAFDPDGDAYGYGISNLPNGLTWDEQGTIFGTLTQAGIFNSSITVVDSFEASTTISIVWNISNASEPDTPTPTHTPTSTASPTSTATPTTTATPTITATPTQEPTAFPPPTTPTIAEISNDGSNSFTVSWSGSSHVLDYRIVERHNNGAWSLQEERTTASSITVTEKALGEWCFRVQALNPHGSSNWSNIACTTVSLNGTTGDLSNIYLPSIRRDIPQAPTVTPTPEPACVEDDIEEDVGEGIFGNNTPGDALDIGAVCTDGRPIVGEITNKDSDFDFYLIRLDQGQQVTIGLQGNSDPSIFVMTLFKGSDVKAHDGSDEDPKEFVEDLESGDYFLAVSSAKGTGKYTLTIQGDE